MTKGLYQGEVKSVSFVNRRYTKKGTFLSKMVYKRIRGQTLGRSLPVLNFVEFPPHPSSPGICLLTFRQCLAKLGTSSVISIACHKCASYSLVTSIRTILLAITESTVFYTYRRIMALSLTGTTGWGNYRYRVKK